MDIDPHTDPDQSARLPQRGELWADPSGEEWLIITRGPHRWVARPADFDMTGWTLAAEADPADAQAAQHTEPGGRRAGVGLPLSRRGSQLPAFPSPPPGSPTDRVRLLLRRTAVFASCPHCASIDRIAAVNDTGSLDPVLFHRGTRPDVGRVHLIVAATGHTPDAASTEFVCTACRLNVSIGTDQGTSG